MLKKFESLGWLLCLQLFLSTPSTAEELAAGRQRISNEVELLAYCFQSPNESGWVAVQHFKQYTLYIKEEQTDLRPRQFYDEPILHRIAGTFSPCYYEVLSHRYGTLRSDEHLRLTYERENKNGNGKRALEHNQPQSEPTKDTSAADFQPSKKTNARIRLFTDPELQNSMIDQLLQLCFAEQTREQKPWEWQGYPWEPVDGALYKGPPCERQVGNLFSSTFAELQIYSKPDAPYEFLSLSFLVGQPYLNGVKISPW